MDDKSTKFLKVMLCGYFTLWLIALLVAFAESCTRWDNENENDKKIGFIQYIAFRKWWARWQSLFIGWSVLNWHLRPKIFYYLKVFQIKFFNKMSENFDPIYLLFLFFITSGFLSIFMVIIILLKLLDWLSSIYDSVKISYKTQNSLVKLYSNSDEQGDKFFLLSKVV